MRDRECSHARGSLRAGGEGGCVLPRARLDARSRHETRVAVRSSSGIQTRSSLERPPALVAQLDRAPDFESGGRGFESLRARQFSPRRVRYSAGWRYGPVSGGGHAWDTKSTARSRSESGLAVKSYWPSRAEAMGFNAS